MLLLLPAKTTSQSDNKNGMLMFFCFLIFFHVIFSFMKYEVFTVAAFDWPTV